MPKQKRCKLGSKPTCVEIVSYANGGKKHRTFVQVAKHFGISEDYTIQCMMNYYRARNEFKGRLGKLKRDRK